MQYSNTTLFDSLIIANVIYLMFTSKKENVDDEQQKKKNGKNIMKWKVRRERQRDRLLNVR